MLSGRIEGATRGLGAPSDWDAAKQGDCHTLSVRDVMTQAGPAMTSAWFPTPDEIARIEAGAPIYLTVFGSGHPPVGMTVGPVPETY